MAAVALKRAYLAAYNWAVFFGWAQVLYYAATTLLSMGHEGVYAAVERPLQLAQTAAVLEILHGLVGLVRSPVSAMLPQIGSASSSPGAYSGASLRPGRTCWSAPWSSAGQSPRSSASPSCKPPQFAETKAAPDDTRTAAQSPGIRGHPLLLGSSAFLHAVRRRVRAR